MPLPGGARFRAVIGDLDSLRDIAALERAGVPVHRLEEQETTDLEKCLYSVEAPLFVGLGFLGGRIDHHLAAMNALVKFARVPVVLVGGPQPLGVGERVHVADHRPEAPPARQRKVAAAVGRHRHRSDRERCLQVPRIDPAGADERHRLRRGAKRRRAHPARSAAPGFRSRS